MHVNYYPLKVEFMLQDKILTIKHHQSLLLYDFQVTGLLTIEFLFKDGGLSFEEAETVPGVHRLQSNHIFRGQRNHHPHHNKHQHHHHFHHNYRTFEAASSQSYMGGNVMNKKTVYSRKEPNVPGQRNHQKKLDPTIVLNRAICNLPSPQSCHNKIMVLNSFITN